MRAGGEGEMPVRRARDVESLGVRKLCRIAVGCTDTQRDRRAGIKHDAAELDPLRGHAVAELVRAFVAQHLFDRRFDQIRMADQALFLIRIPVERHEAVANQVGGGLVAGIEQEDAIVQQLLLGQPLAVLLAITFSLDQSRQHVALGIARPLATAHDQCREIGEKVRHGFIAARSHFRRHHRFERTEDRQRPVAQRLALVMGNVEQIADHLDGDRCGEVLDQFAITFGGDGVEQAVNQLDDIRLHPRDRTR
ncbi:hypothetical protein ACVWZZ_007040 [Bradyrhizobium sp. LM6.10]